MNFHHNSTYIDLLSVYKNFSYNVMSVFDLWFDLMQQYVCVIIKTHESTTRGQYCQQKMMKLWHWSNTKMMLVHFYATQNHSPLGISYILALTNGEVINSWWSSQASCCLKTLCRTTYYKSALFFRVLTKSEETFTLNVHFCLSDYCIFMVFRVLRFIHICINIKKIMPKI